MIKIAKQTGLAPEEIIDRASKFFGKGGEGLEEKERNPCCLSFEGAGGFVSITIYVSYILTFLSSGLQLFDIQLPFDPKIFS